MTIFWVENSIILCKLAHIFFLRQLKINIIFSFVILVALQKKVGQQIFCCCFWILDPRSRIRDPGSEIRDPGLGMDKNQDQG
jgi:hypothetical protein